MIRIFSSRDKRLWAEELRTFPEIIQGCHRSVSVIFNDMEQ